MFKKLFKHRFSIIVKLQQWMSDRNSSEASYYSGSPSLKLLAVGVASATAATGYTCWCSYRNWHSKLISDPKFESVHFIRTSTVGYNKESNGFCWLPTDVYRALDGVASMPVRQGDIFVASFPKAGTTWLQELVFMLATGFDSQLADSVSIEDRFPYLEYPYPGLATIEHWPVQTERRFIKTHLPWSLLPRAVIHPDGDRPVGVKVIYLGRCPKDTAISYYDFLHMLRPLIGYTGDLRDFIDRFIDCKDKPMPYGPWLGHIVPYWLASQKEPGRVLFLTYEELQADTAECALRVARFLELPEPDSALVDRIVEFCSFPRMRLRPTTSYSWYRSYGAHDPSLGFYRRGKSGGWRDQLTDEESARFDEELLGPLMRQCGLAFGPAD